MSLTSMQADLSSKQSAVSAQQANIAGLQTKIAAIDALYQTLKGQKESMNTLKKDVNTMADEEHEFWKGNLIKTKYQEPLKSNVVEGGYATIVTQIDTNLDALNTAKTECENQILASQGLIGQLAAGINTLINAIENFVN